MSFWRYLGWVCWFDATDYATGKKRSFSKNRTSETKAKPGRVALRGEQRSTVGFFARCSPCDGVLLLQLEGSGPSDQQLRAVIPRENEFSHSFSTIIRLRHVPLLKPSCLHRGRLHH